MASHASTADEGLQSGVDGQQLRQNTDLRDSASVQASDLTNLSSPRDSKRSNAARLARELGSLSPWSESLMPQTYGTLSSQTNSTSAGPTTRQEVGDPIQVTPLAPQDSDPPPAYSRTLPLNEIHPVYELPTEAPDNEITTISTMQEEREEESLPQTDLEQNQTTNEVVADTETPLLSHPVRRRTGGRCWQWIQKGRTKRRRFGRLLFAVIFFIVITSIVLCVVTGDSGKGFSFLQPPAETSQPLVRTGPDYRRHETIENINGAYKLYDRLELTTNTGSIDIEVEPESGDHPAILILSSDFGSITLRVSTDYLKRRKRVQRTIYTEIRSITGTVGAEILLGHGGSTLVDTGSGPQNLWILGSGIGPHDEMSNLTTISRTGLQKIILLSLEAPYKPISKLRAEHHTLGTASLDITYPSVWLGELHTIAAPFGRVAVSGDGLQFQRQEHDFVEAYRGLGDNFTLVEVISEGIGSASFRC